MCRHGHTGYCHDEATPEQRQAFNFLHAHAYAWALPYGRDEAEEYASRFAAQNFDAPDDAGSHSHESYCYKRIMSD